MNKTIKGILFLQDQVVTSEYVYTPFPNELFKARYICVKKHMKLIMQ